MVVGGLVGGSVVVVTAVLVGTFCENGHRKCHGSCQPPVGAAVVKAMAAAVVPMIVVRVVDIASAVVLGMVVVVVVVGWIVVLISCSVAGAFALVVDSTLLAVVTIVAGVFVVMLMLVQGVLRLMMKRVVVAVVVVVVVAVVVAKVVDKVVAVVAAVQVVVEVAVVAFRWMGGCPTSMMAFRASWSLPPPLRVLVLTTCRPSTLLKMLSMPERYSPAYTCRRYLCSSLTVCESALALKSPTSRMPSP